jgi:eukaryotic-like serine/threonine-protein kinase
MSPEQVEAASDLDGRSDIWSLGVTLYELLSGDAPFEADSIIALAVKIREATATPLDVRNPAVPREVAVVVGRCLAKKKEERFADIAELVAALAPFAPRESMGLVDRITQQSVSPLAETMRQGPVALPSAPGPVALQASVSTSGPVASQVPASASSSLSLRPLAFIAGAGVLVASAFFYGRTSMRNTQTVNALPSSPPPAVSSAPVVPSIALAASSIAPVASSAGVPVASTPPRSHARPVAPAKSATPPNLPPTPPPVPSGPRRRELDRDDPR